MTGAPMMDCKKALDETNGDIEAAQQWLRKKGMATAQKKSGRSTAQGLVTVAQNDRTVSLLELNSETDFVARNEVFQAAAKQFTDVLLDSNVPRGACSSTNVPSLVDGDDIKALKAASGETIGDEVTKLIASVGENCRLNRGALLSVPEGKNGFVAHYIHNKMGEGMGQIGAAVAIEAEVPSEHEEAAQKLARDICMHVAAASPKFISRDSVPSDSLDKERALLMDQARSTGKPEEILKKIVEGRLSKFFEETTLLEQNFLLAPEGEEGKVKKFVDAFSKKSGSPFTIAGFLKLKVGESQ
eukprot:CAMPEP_0113867416 /NCGR_PEP_ID=MMETSP0780_2-20120614/405_1 /TAXON_ID=652834 /ORGANISM="Palpitomonas bilix" /LENGTH=299 /DNA_ID=CAMNT_0000852353 /DNA_START=50 /DNA_END=949 /DNA_ORIENTATION=- /assembly_acc=CAM_ASM_000599